MNQQSVKEILKQRTAVYKQRAGLSEDYSSFKVAEQPTEKQIKENIEVETDPDKIKARAILEGMTDDIPHNVQVMARRVAEEYPEFIVALSPSEKTDGMYRRLRAVQKNNLCCGEPINKAEVKEVILLALRDGVRNFASYLGKCLSRGGIKHTLEIVRGRLKKVMWEGAVCNRLGIWGETVKFWKSLAHDWSEDSIMRAVEIAQKKKDPVAYFTTILKRGLLPERQYS